MVCELFHVNCRVIVPPGYSTGLGVPLPAEYPLNKQIAPKVLEYSQFKL